MKQSHVLITVLIAAIAFNSCKKKDLPEAEQGNTPQFYFTGNVNGSDVNLQAGVNNYYMYSGYDQNSTTGVYGFNAILKAENCTTCNNSIEIQINDWRQSPYNGASGIDSAFQSVYYPYCMGTWAPIAYNLYFYPIFNNTPTSYLWDFGDGSTSTSMMGSHLYKNAGNYNVSLTVTDNFSCGNTITNLQTVGRTDNMCRTTITVTSTSSLNANYSQSTTGSGSFSFYWDFGDGNTSSLSTPSHSYANNGRYPVSLRVIDNIYKDTADANINYVTAGSNTCTTNYIMYKDSAIVNTTGVSNIIVKWTDSNGIVYTSNDAAQPDDSYFKILSSEEYHINEAGQKTKKLHIKFRCKVYNGSTNLLIDNADAIVVVAYK
jgi:PKD repeat protein